MSLNAVVDVSIGLIFVFLVVSLIASALNEILAGLFRWRASHLETTIRNFLAGQDIVDHRGLRIAIADAVLEHPLIVKMGKPGKRSSDPLRGPSYLSARTFALALMSVVQRSTGGQDATLTSHLWSVRALPEGPVRDALETLVTDAADDAKRARHNIELWYDNAMDRTSGYYKRKIQVRLMGIGLAIAVGLNIDSLVIFKRLWTDSTVRAEMVGRATNFDYAAVAGIDPKKVNLLDKNEKRIADLRIQLDQLPVGWPPIWPGLKRYAYVDVDNDKRRLCILQADESCVVCQVTGERQACVNTQPGKKEKTDSSNDKQPGKMAAESPVTVFTARYREQNGLVIGFRYIDYAIAHWATIGLAFVGWVITAFAASLGAPFWFDGLSRVLSLRSSIRRASTLESSTTGPAPTGTEYASTSGQNQSFNKSRRDDGPRSEFENNMLSVNDIGDIQTALGLTGLAVTGVLDAATREAIKIAQIRLGRDGTGLLSPFLVERLLGQV